MTTTEDKPAQERKTPRLGEELPIFCERCGYSLHGLMQIRCEHCTVLQFHCPECGHHQPINTLRPEVQVWLGRLRAWLLGFGIFFRINFFIWLLVAWMSMGYDWGYALRSMPSNSGMSLEVMMAFGLFGLGFGIVSRMLLLRWRHGWVIALILASLATIAVLVGFKIWLSERRQVLHVDSDRWLVLALTFAAVANGVMLAWPAWVAMVFLFLPKRTAKSLLDWQRSLSDGSSLART